MYIYVHQAHCRLSPAHSTSVARVPISGHMRHMLLKRLQLCCSSVAALLHMLRTYETHALKEAAALLQLCCSSVAYAQDI